MNQREMGDALRLYENVFYGYHVWVILQVKHLS